MWLYRKILMSDWEWLQRATTIENDGFLYSIQSVWNYSCET